MDYDQLFKLIEHDTSKNEDDIIRMIESFYDDTKLMESALEILDKTNQIIEFRGSCKYRKIWKIIGSKDKSYYCLYNFCPCQSYENNNKSSSKVVLCKHLLAIRIALALRKTLETVISDEEFILSSLQLYKTDIR